MKFAAYQAIPYVLMAFPFVLATGAAALWWGNLARPWIFLVLGNVALYGLIVVAVLVANQFVSGGYFLEVNTQGSKPQGPAVEPFTLAILLALAAFVVIAGAILWGLKVWLASP